MPSLSWERIEALLSRVQKPGRYVGGEYNAVHRPWDGADVHVCLAFPDLYDLGMSNFALMILYDILNRAPGVLAERTYLPAPDMIAEMRDAGLPLYSLESYRPVADFDVLAIATAYEQLYTNALELLSLSGLPIHAAARDTSHPLVIGGGHGTFNPEPITDFFDVFVIGEAEDVMLELVDGLRQTSAGSRETQLRRLAAIDGLYVPRFYSPTYATAPRTVLPADHSQPSASASPTGPAPCGLPTSASTLVALQPTVPEAPSHVLKRIMPTLPPTPIRQLVPNVETVHNRAVVEIHRGCTRGCRFCQAGSITRPVRERPVAEIVDAAEAILEATGYSEVALLSLSSADYSQIPELIRELQARFAGRNISISLPSLRIDSFSVELAAMLSDGRRSGFTFAPEAGSDALRHRINKNISTAALLSVAEEVFARGWRSIKLYFMIGLPTETDADVEAIIDLAHEVRRIGQRLGGRKAEVHVSVSTFVPKPHTVFQWEPLTDGATVERRQEMLRAGIRGRGFSLSWNPYPGTQLEALLARGDRWLNAVVERAWQLGARFDAWDDWRNQEAWERAIAERPSDELQAQFSAPESLLDFYLYRRRSEDEFLPWDHLQSGVEKRFFLRDYRRSQAGELLVDCRDQCHACGILQSFPDLRTEEWQCPVLR